MTKPASMAADTGLPDDIAVPPPTLGADMTRRDILKAGAKGAAAVAVPVAALAMPAGAGSEIMRLFREWEATIGAHPPAWASRKESDAFYSATGARQDEISEQMARMEPTTAQELAAIVMARTIYGGLDMDEPVISRLFALSGATDPEGYSLPVGSDWPHRPGEEMPA